MQTREQQIARCVFEKVSSLTEKDETHRKEYGSMAHKLPVLIRTAGLAQATAFVQARGKKPHTELLTHLAEVIEKGNGAKLATRSREADIDEYMYLTEQALAALLWFKRFAESVLGVESGAEEENNHDTESSLGVESGAEEENNHDT